MSIEIHGLEEAEKFLKGLGTTSKKALSQTIDTLANNARDKAVTLTTGELNLSNQFVKEQFTIEESSAKKLLAKVRAKKSGLSLGNFGATQSWTGSAGKRKRAGVKINVKRKLTLKKAFLFKSKKGKNLVAIRTGKGKNEFDVLYGPSPSQAFDTFQDQLAKYVTDEFSDVFFNELDKIE